MSRNSPTLPDAEHDDTIDDSTTVAATAPVRQQTSACVRCQKPATFMCSSCGLDGPRYCSVECQKLDWKEQHYNVCESTLAARRARRATREEQRRSQGSVQHRTSYSRFSAALSVNSRRGPRRDGSNEIAMSELGDSGNGQRSRDADDADFDEEYADDLRFYVQQIYFIIRPVVVCIILSIFWVKVAFSGSSDYSPTRSPYAVFPSTSTSSNGSSGGGSSSSSSNPGMVGSLTNALIIVGQMVLVTIIILFLFKKGWIKVLYVFFMIIILLLLGFMTYVLLLNLIQVFSIPIDYITLAFALWNFAIVGLVTIFWRGPLWLQQGYLTVLCSLMAFSLTGLSEWTTWILLGLLAVWDLIAVLCPFGPLRMLIESSRSQQREVPALLYSVNAVWLMVSAGSQRRLSKSTVAESETLNQIGRGSSTSEALLYDQRRTRTYSSLTDTIQTMTPSSSEDSASISSTSPLQSNQAYQSPVRSTQHGHSSLSLMSSSLGPGAVTVNPGTQVGTFVRLRNENASSSTVVCRMESRRGSAEVGERDEQARDGQDQQEEKDEEDAERSGLKLGLGDFVFYSVLIARAALYDWITTICCTIAVLTGLTATIFLLAIYKKALPALPISIAFGILFYFVAKTVLVPYVGALCVFDMIGL